MEITEEKGKQYVDKLYMKTNHIYQPEAFTYKSYPCS